MVVAVWAGQTLSGVAETEELHITVAKDGAKRAVATKAEGATRLPRRQGPGRTGIGYP